MSIYLIVTEQGLSLLQKLAEQQKNQRAPEIKNRILKQTHDINLVENLSPITKKLDEVNESTNKIGELVKKSDVEDEITQIPPIENITGTQSLRDTLIFLRRGNFFFKLEEKSNGDIFWNGVFIQPFRENRINVKNRNYDITPDIQVYFTNTKLTTKFLRNAEKETVFDILENVGFYYNIHKEGLKSAKIKDVLYILPKAMAKIRNPPLPVKENIEDVSDNLQREGVKTIIPSNIIDNYTTHEILIGAKFSGHSDTLTEASNLKDDLYKREKIQNTQQYQNALSKFSTQ